MPTSLPRSESDGGVRKIQKRWRHPEGEKRYRAGSLRGGYKVIWGPVRNVGIRKEAKTVPGEDRSCTGAGVGCYTKGTLRTLV